MSGLPPGYAVAPNPQPGAAPGGAPPPPEPAPQFQPIAPKIGSGVGTAIDYLSSPMAPIIGGARDLHYQREQLSTLTGPARAAFEHKIRTMDPDAWPNFAQIKRTVMQGGLSPSAVHSIVEQHGVTSPGPGGFAQGDPPLARAAIETGAQLLNPVGEVTGLVARGAGALSRAGAAAAKPVGRAIEAGLKRSDAGQSILQHLTVAREGAAPFAGLRKAAQQAGVDPTKAEQVGRTFLSAKRTADRHAVTITKQIFDGMTRAQRVEIERLSENFGPHGVVNPPRLPDPDGTLYSRALRYRGVIHQMTGDQQTLDLLKPDRTFDATLYSPRSDAYASQVTNPDVKSFRSVFGASSRSDTPTSRIKLGTAGQNGGSKVFEHYDEAERSGLLDPKNDPATNLVRYLSQRGSAVAKEAAVRDLQGLGMLPELEVVDPRSIGQGGAGFLGRGEQGVQAAQRVGSARARAGAYTDALSDLNAQRVARGDAPVNPTELHQMQRAVAGKGRAYRVAGAADQAQRTLGGLSARTAKAATAVNQRAGQALLQQLQTKVRDVDALNVKIDKFRERVETGDKKAAAKQLAAMVSRRDEMALLVEQARDAVQRQAENALGVRPREASGFAHTRPGDDSTATARGLGKEGVRVPSQRGVSMVSQLYAPVVGKLQELYQTAGALQSSPERGRVLRQIGALAQRALRAPTKVGDTSDRYGQRMLRQLQNAMTTVARAGRDDTSQRIVKELQSVSARLEAAITRDDTSLYRRKDLISKPAERAAAIVAGADQKAAKKAQALLAAYDFAKQSEPDVRAFARAFDRAMLGRSAQETERILRHSEVQAANTYGRIPAREAEVGSPTMEFATADPAVVRFFRSQGATEPQARGVGALVDGMNQLARMGIITNPVVHAGWNLGTHFLAAGGDPQFFLRRVWTDPAKWEEAPSAAYGRTMTGIDWMEEAARNNALVEHSSTHSLFGGDFGVTLTGPKVVSKEGFDERGLIGSIDAAASRLWQQNQRIVFDAFERRYSTELFRHFVENERMAPEAAGIAVRKALGDYANVSRSGVERALTRTLLFYPWMKTAIPFWIKTVATKPNFITVPGVGVRRWDEAAGDPQQKDFRIYLGRNADGSDRYMTYPGPQKWAADLLEMIAPQGEIGEGGPGSIATEALKVGRSHLAPWGAGGAIGQAIDATKTMTSKPQEPAPQFGIMFNKGESPLVATGQAAQYELGGLPFAGAGQGMARTVTDLSHGDARGLLGAAGGFQYDVASKADRHALNRIENQLDRGLAQAAKVRKHNPEAAQRREAQVRETYERRMQAFQQRRQERERTSSFPPGYTIDGASGRGLPPGYSVDASSGGGLPAGYTVSP